MLLYCLFKFKLTRFFPARTTHWGRVFRFKELFCDINNGFNGKSHYKLLAIFLSNRWHFSHQPVLPHISIEVPTIHYEKSSIQLKEKLSELVKAYYWFISKGGNFDAKKF